MAKTSKMSTFDASLMFDQAVGQFRGLNTNDPGQWPMLPKLASWVVLAAAVVVLGWFLVLSDATSELEAERKKEPGLRKEYRDKLAQAVNNQAGIGRNLQFELFRPGSVAVRDYYAELPISIRVSGRYHDLGAFTADIANLSRIVTLHDLTISGGGREGVLSMDGTARTYRYLDAGEVAAQKKPAGAKK
jgi:type IV pilus assembly protein PilO